MTRTNRNSRMPHVLFATLAVLLAFVILVPETSFAGDRRGHYFGWHDTHDQYFARRDTIALGAGDAKNHNAAIHTIDPWPWYAKNDRLQFDGQRMELGITRYQANESIEPRGMESEAFSPGGGGQGGEGTLSPR